MDIYKERLRNIERQYCDYTLRSQTLEWMKNSNDYKYCYLHNVAGVPSIQYTQDIVEIQNIIWRTRPDLIIETGVAHGGSLLSYAMVMSAYNKRGLVIGIENALRDSNRSVLSNHELAEYLRIIEGSSTEHSTYECVKDVAKNYQSIMVILDSNHSHDHVYRELQYYGELVTKNCYMIVMDTIIECLPKGFLKSTKWDQGNNPLTAVYEYLASNSRFIIDHYPIMKTLVSSNPSGYLKCIR